MVVTEVGFDGQERVSPSTLRHLADVHIGTRMWEVALQDVERNVARHPWVRAVNARRVYPDKIEVDVQEHVPRALLVRPQLIAIDARGQAIAEVGRSDLALPLFTGVDEQLGREHPDLPELVVQCQLDLLRDVEALLEGTDAFVSEVHFSKRQGFTVYAGRAEVLFSHGDFERQFAKLDYLVSEEGLRLDHAIQVDLAPEELAVVVPRVGARSG